VNYQALVRRMHGGTNRLKQAQARRNVEHLAVAVLVDRNSVDVFHDDVGAAIGECAAVDQVRDIRMIQLGEDLALDLEPGLHAAREHAATHDLDGHPLLELFVGALGEIDFAHAADPQAA